VRDRSDRWTIEMLFDDKQSVASAAVAMLLEQRIT
jgi:hypothetical protein